MCDEAGAPTNKEPPSPPPADFFVAGKEFHLKEYESLKKEIETLVEHSRKLEIYALAGSAALYAWYLNDGSHSVRSVLLIPILIALLGGLRSWSVLARIYEIAEYLRLLEAAICLRDLKLKGWETHRFENNKTNLFHESPFASSAAVFWLVLFGVSIWAHCALAVK